MKQTKCRIYYYYHYVLKYIWKIFVKYTQIRQSNTNTNISSCGFPNTNTNTDICVFEYKYKYKYKYVFDPSPATLEIKKLNMVTRRLFWKWLKINRLLPMATINMHMKFEIPNQTWLMLQKLCHLQVNKVNQVYTLFQFCSVGV